MTTSAIDRPMAASDTSAAAVASDASNATSGPAVTSATAPAAAPGTPRRSDATAHAVAFVAARRVRAEQLGDALADDLHAPDALATALRAALEELADPAYLAGQRHVAPGIGALHGVRWPLLAALGRGFRRGTKGVRPTPLLDVATRLLREPELEAHWFAFGVLERVVAAEPERTWQLLRAAASTAGDWITVDTLAHPVGAGILAETYRWAELDQLVFSPSRWERRLVGSTVATLPHIDRTRGRTPDVVAHGLELVDQLLGDREPDVKKALAWALRTLAQLDREATTRLLGQHATLAAETRDGHRAWVIRDTLAKLDPDAADRLRAQLHGIRVDAAAPSTSTAAATSAAWERGGLGVGIHPADRWVVPRDAPPSAHRPTDPDARRTP